MQSAGAHLTDCNFHLSGGRRKSNPCSRLYEIHSDLYVLRDAGEIPRVSPSSVGTDPDSIWHPGSDAFARQVPPTISINRIPDLHPPRPQNRA